jgi:hypothetical protein
MKTNYINQLQRDIIRDCDHTNSTQEQSILSIEDRADKWVFEINGHKWSNNDSSAGDNYGSFIAGANEMLPIIKELGEALIKANLYVPPKFYGQGESINNEDYQTIQTTLEKYKNIQYDTQRTNGKHL